MKVLFYKRSKNYNFVGMIDNFILYGSMREFKIWLLISFEQNTLSPRSQNYVVLKRRLCFEKEFCFVDANVFTPRYFKQGCKDEYPRKTLPLDFVEGND